MPFKNTNKNRAAQMINALANGEVVTLKNNKERSELLDYMDKCDIDPCDYRSERNEVWMA